MQLLTDTPAFEVGDRVTIIASGLEATVCDKFTGALTHHTVYVLSADPSALGFYGSELRAVRS